MLAHQAEDLQLLALISELSPEPEPRPSSVFGHLAGQVESLAQPARIS